MEKNLNVKADGKGAPMHSFSEALSAAKENIGPSLKNAIVDSAERFSTLANDTKDQLIAKGRDASKVVNRDVHVQPWTYIASAGVLGLTLGYILARRK